MVIAGVLAGLGAVVGAVLNPYHDTSQHLLVYTPVELLVGWTFLFVGLIAGRRRPLNRTGLMMSVFGLVWFAYALGWIPSPVPYALSDLFRTAFLVVLGHLYIVYPHGRASGRLEKGAIAAIYAWFVLSAVGDQLTYDPAAWGCLRCFPNPFYIAGTAWLSPPIRLVSEIGTIVVAVAVLGIFVKHWKEASAPVRRAMAPAAWSAVPVFAVVVAGQLAWLAPDWLAPVIGPVQWLTLIALPVGLLIGVLRTRLGRGAVTDLVIDSTRSETVGVPQWSSFNSSCISLRSFRSRAPSGSSRSNTAGRFTTTLLRRPG